MFACFCLNILIDTAPDDFEKVIPEFLNLDENCRDDSFFLQELLQVGKSLNITKVHSSLVQIRSVGHWDIHCCINCVCEAYAVHRTKGASCVLIYSKLRDSQSIQRVKDHDVAFSKVFNIIINPSQIRANSAVLNSYRNCYAEIIMKNIRHIMKEFMKKEHLAVEDRIKTYSEEQYEIYNNLKEKTYQEHDSLARYLQDLADQVKPESTKNSVSSTMLEASSSLRLNNQSFENIKSVEKLPTSTKTTPKRHRSTPVGEFSSFDTEGLFEFEGSDDVYSLSGTDVEESDREENVEGGINMPQKPKSKGSIAKSLPMNIPTFMSQMSRNRSTEEIDDLPHEENLDIAASIKALARSVHGDAVFGELPRPRFSTQI